ncbi:unnamed protein product [Macrosiphum euphorbiae]|uniref:Uncharacterized protein n=1 Tax=Macrosiphum euphorbiae TaxID=13131 RepID=A0AAV0WTW8_9HEMI|nr:unnamed protein product [Macrosiphum euphorbiae]
MAPHGITFLRLTGWSWKIVLALIACNHLALMWPFFFAVGCNAKIENQFKLQSAPVLREREYLLYYTEYCDIICHNFSQSSGMLKI